MKGCDVHLKWQSTEAIQLKLDRKMSSDIQPKVQYIGWYNLCHYSTVHVAAASYIVIC